MRGVEGEQDEHNFVKVLDMKKESRKVKVLIEFETFMEWVDLENALEDWPDEVKAFKEKWEQQRTNKEQEKKMKKRKSDGVFRCDLNHDDPSLVTFIFCH